MNTRKFCKCGCGADITHKRRGARWASESCRKADIRGESPRKLSKRRPSGRAGRQISYRKAVQRVERLINELLDPDELLADSLRDEAERILSPCLSQRERQRLKERQAA